MLKKQYPLYLANKPVMHNSDLEVFDKYTGEKVTSVAQADAEIIDKAIAKATEATEPMRSLPAYHRQDVLNHCVNRFMERKEELAEVLCIEVGKPIRDSRGEVERLIDTFKIAAEESIRIYGEYIPLDISPRAKNYTGIWKRVPIGACSLISPFNFPLNLVAHKIAPALAAGCPFVLKPASLTPVGALIIGEILAEADLPEGAFSILPCPRSIAGSLVTDDRLKLLSFTGSPKAGWDIKSKAGKKKVTLELGGNAGVVVDKDADIGDAVERIIIGAFYQSGQSCISVQRIIVHEAIYEELKNKLLKATSQLKVGDPKDENTFIGPLISESEAEKVEDWIKSAINSGGKLLCGGKRKGTIIEATLLEEVPKEENVCAKEIFGPVAVLSKFTDFDEALSEVNDSVYGLQAGVFTRDIYKIQKAWDVLDVGGVVIGDIPSWRVDHMPYGGVKNSGLGREGIRFSIKEMTEMKLLVIRNPNK